MAKIRTEVEVPDGDYCYHNHFFASEADSCVRLDGDGCTLFVNKKGVPLKLKTEYQRGDGDCINPDLDVVFKLQACRNATYRETENDKDKD